MKKILNIKYLVLLCCTIVCTGYAAWAQQIGGNPSPLYTSTHRYSIEMDDVANSFSWSVYAGNITSTQIDEATVSPLPATGYFTFGETDIDGTDAFVEIKFDGDPVNMPYFGYNSSNGGYTLAYTEVTDGEFECPKTVVYTFTLYPPIDVDIKYISQSGSECPDSTGIPQVDFNSKTTRTYNVTLAYPEANPGYSDDWNFTLDVSVVGNDGVSATIHSVSIDGTLIEENINLSAYDTDYTVPEGTQEVEVSIVYNDVLSVTQSIMVELSYISGSFSERDVDEIDKTQGNIEEHVIFAMPDVGNIIALN